MSITVSSFFGELAALAAGNILPPIFAVANSTLADIEANPQEWINPVSGMIKGQAALSNIMAAVIPAENAAVPAAAQLVGGIFSAIQAKLASLEAGQTATGIGEQIGSALVGAVSQEAKQAAPPAVTGTGLAPVAVPASAPQALPPGVSA